jgi:hypothetical protein
MEISNQVESSLYVRRPYDGQHLSLYPQISLESCEVKRFLQEYMSREPAEEEIYQKRISRKKEFE